MTRSIESASGSVIQSIPRVPSTVWAVDMADSYAQQGVDIVQLAGGPLSPLPHHIIEAGQMAVADDEKPPSRGAGRLLQAISEKLESENGVLARPQNEIVVANGAMQALYCSMLAHTEGGDQVAMFGPGFFVHHLITLTGGEPLIIPCSEEDEFHVDLTRLVDSITPRTKILLLINPVNPTGAVFTAKELTAIAEIAQARDLLVIADEAYEKFVYDDHKHISIASLPGMRDRTLTVHSFTKCYGLRSSRVGYVTGPESLIRPILKVFEWSTLTCNPVSQAMAHAALTGPQNWLESAYDQFKDNRMAISEALEGSYALSAVLPEGATFFYVNISVPDVDSHSFCRYLLANYGVPTVPGSEFAGAAGMPDRYLRLPFGGDGDAIGRAIDALRSASAAALNGQLVRSVAR